MKQLRAESWATWAREHGYEATARPATLSEGYVVEVTIGGNVVTCSESGMYRLERGEHPKTGAKLAS